MASHGPGDHVADGSKEMAQCSGSGKGAAGGVRVAGGGAGDEGVDVGARFCHLQVGRDHGEQPLAGCLCTLGSFLDAPLHLAEHHFSHSLLEPCFVPEVAVEHRFGCHGSGGNLLHGGIAAEGMDCPARRFDQLPPPVLAVLLPTRGAAVDGRGFVGGSAGIRTISGVVHDTQRIRYAGYR